MHRAVHMLRKALKMPLRSHFWPNLESVQAETKVLTQSCKLYGQVLKISNKCVKLSTKTETHRFQGSKEIPVQFFLSFFFRWTKRHTLFSKVVLYLKLCIEDNGGRGRVMQRQQFLILIEARLSNLSYAKVQVIYIIFWPGGLLTFWETYFSLKVIIPKSGATLRNTRPILNWLLS